MTIWPMRLACWIRKYTNTHTHTHTHTHRIYNIDCFSSAKMAARMRLNVTLFVHCLSCFDILIRARLSDKKLLKIIRGFQFSLQLLSKTFPILKRMQRDTITNVYSIHLHVKYMLFFSYCNQEYIFGQIFEWSSKYQISGKFFQYEPSCSMRTDMTKLNVGFRHVVNETRLKKEL